MKSPSPPPALTPPRLTDSPDEELIDFEPTGLVEQVRTGRLIGFLNSAKTKFVKRFR